MSRRRNISILFILMVAALIIGYVIFNSRLILTGPQIIVQSPESGSTFTEPFIELRGTAKNTSFISLNENQIFVDENSVFVEKLLLPPGTSIMKLAARDRFNREKEITLWYTFTGSSAVPATSSIQLLATTTPETIDDTATSTASSTIE